jgi:hypothetical protein
MRQELMLALHASLVRSCVDGTSKKGAYQLGMVSCPLYFL